MNDLPDIEELESTAVWSGDGPEDSTYRYRLDFQFPYQTGPSIGFVMMNPSYANETQWDNTVRRCAGYAHDWGYGGLQIGNIFAFRTPFPKGGTDKHGNEWPPIWEQDDPVGPQNDEHLRQIAQSNHMVICAWGNAGRRLGRGQEALSVLANAARCQLAALTVNKSGHPAHPLYLRKDLKPDRITAFENFQEGELSVPEGCSASV